MNTASKFREFIESGVVDRASLEKAFEMFNGEVTSAVMLDSDSCPGIPEGGVSTIISFDDRSILMAVSNAGVPSVRVFAIPAPESEPEKLLGAALGLVMVALMKADADNG